jgi:hypothetical protein
VIRYLPVKPLSLKKGDGVPTYRNIWTFTGQDGGSWNEVYYEDQSSISATGPGLNLINARLNLLHPLNKWRAIRIVDVDVPRATRPITLNLAGGNDGGGAGPAPNSESIVCAMSSLAGGGRKLWLRGAPDSFIIKSPVTGADAPPASLTKFLGYFFAQLKVNGYGIRQLSGIVPGPLSPLKILKVDGTAGDGTSLVTLAVAPGYPFPSRVTIGGASKKDLPALNGQWSLVQAPAGAVVRIPYQTPAAGIVMGGSAHMRQAIYHTTHVFDPASCAFDHYGSHSTRSTNFRSRGARRAQRLRTSL